MAINKTKVSARVLIGLCSGGYKHSTGDGHRIATKLGACLIGMEGYHGGIIHYGYKKFPWVGEEKGMRSVKKYEPGILVNRDGKRFVDEGEDTADKTYAKFVPPLSYEI